MWPFKLQFLALGFIFSALEVGTWGYIATFNTANNGNTFRLLFACAFLSSVVEMETEKSKILNVSDLCYSFCVTKILQIWLPMLGYISCIMKRERAEMSQSIGLIGISVNMDNSLQSPIPSLLSSCLFFSTVILTGVPLYYISCMWWV